MRAVVLIILSILALPAAGQSSEFRVYVLNHAIRDALNNNPTPGSDSIRGNLVIEIKANWYNWIYRIQKSMTYQEYYQSLEDLPRVAGLRFEAGDIDYYETSSLIERMADIATCAAVSRNEVIMYQNNLKQLLYVSDSIAPADSGLSLYEVDKSPLFPHSGFSITDTLSDEYGKFVHDLRVENKQIELDNLFIRIQYYRSYGLDRAQAIISITKAKLRSESVDYLEYAGLISEAYKIRLDYLSVLNNYNQCAIQLEHYAY